MRSASKCDKLASSLLFAFIFGIAIIVKSFTDALVLLDV